ncbi:hypothetical protein [Streptomyces sp. NPDC048111]|uniref:hypothetical protein n=1 Tax=Streptomyces sp. NPDC048111 TaxID=3365500 RepID=UPI00371B0C2B
MTEQQPPEQDPYGSRPAGGPAQGWGQQPPPYGQPPQGQPPYGPPPGWGQQPPPPPRRRFGRGVLVGCLSALVLLVAIVVAIVLVTGSDTKSPSPTATNSGVRSSGGAHAAEDDVSITSCAIDPSSFATAKLEILNHSTKTSDYTITVEFLAANGTRIGESSTFQSALASGERAEDRVVAPTEEKGTITCRLTAVQRFASLG